jgi:hypothetical protein
MAGSMWDFEDGAAGARKGPGAAGRPGWGRSTAVALVLLVAFLGNRRASIVTYDTFPNEVLPYALIRGDGPFLDRFAFTLAPPGGRPPDYVSLSQGHLLSRHPIGAAILAVPLTLPQVWYLDRFEPGWDRDGYATMWYCSRMAKNTAAVVVVLAALVLLRVLYRLGLGRVAVPTVLGASLGSDLWAVASQASWQHGPAALALTSVIWLLLPRPVPRLRLALAGLATSALVAIRPVDVVFAAVVVLWLLRTRPKGLAWFLPPALPIAAALLAYNLWYFDALEGGQAQLEALHPTVHGVRGVWTGDLLAGASGTLLSPARGLFVFCPWVALALLALPATAPRIRAYPVVAWLIAGLLPYFLMFAKYSVWWAGHSFGPRYWIDATPLLAILLGFALDWCRLRCRPLLFPFALAILWSVAVQAVGAFCYPSSWNLSPANVDRHHERLWDWRDSEIVRCLREGRKPW